MSDTDAMNARPLTKADFDYIVKVLDKWWAGPSTALAHPIFFYELGDLARVVEHDGRLVGFLLGFIARGPVGYIHLVGIDPDFRRRHVGTLLYAAFEKACLAAGCQRLKAITTLGNEAMIRFHEALGWTKEEIADYAGPGRMRVVLSKQLG